MAKGWKDLGEVCGHEFVAGNGKTYMNTPICSFCNHELHIGKEDGVLFKFCLRCMVKVGESKKISNE